LSIAVRFLLENNFQLVKPNRFLYSPYYVEVCN